MQGFQIRATKVVIQQGTPAPSADLFSKIQSIPTEKTGVLKNAPAPDLVATPTESLLQATQQIEKAAHEVLQAFPPSNPTELDLVKATLKAALRKTRFLAKPVTEHITDPQKQLMHETQIRATMMHLPFIASLRAMDSVSRFAQQYSQGTGIISALISKNCISSIHNTQRQAARIKLQRICSFFKLEPSQCYLPSTRMGRYNITLGSIMGQLNSAARLTPMPCILEIDPKR